MWMMEGSWWILAVLLPGVLRGQQSPPCLNCESYVQDNQDNIIVDEFNQQVNSDWECSDEGCRRQEGEPCDSNTLCDHGLSCQYNSALAQTGVCKEVKGLACTVYNHTYGNGDTFMLDCRTQCTCQDGRYACASLCPKENISPLGISCRHPRLVDIPGQCCREWMCDSHSELPPPDCRYSPWTACPDDCGAGLSRRQQSSPQCAQYNETRLCQLRPCPEPGPMLHLQSGFYHSTHRLRKGHECKATRRANRAVRLRFASCLSIKRYRPKWCGDCISLYCAPELSTTLKVKMLCRQPEDTVEDVTQGSDLWGPEGSAERRLTSSYAHPITVMVEWITKCKCSTRQEHTASTTRLPEILLHRVHRTAAP
ncbi:cellular communication network factor protein Ccn isoform X2 [Rhodnius prolixus]|uniref:cellular communication network factor protein Ccn isoform X2 n=1 Tax=Rhodnius prolixus TaxID=13249 RepID=UPI003D18EEE7